MLIRDEEFWKQCDIKDWTCKSVKCNNLILCGLKVVKTASFSCDHMTRQDNRDYTKAKQYSVTSKREEKT